MSVLSFSPFNNLSRQRWTMIKILCSFADELPTDPIGFDLGDMEIIGKHGSFSSKFKHPNQSLMLILSLVSLLDGLRRLLSTPKEKEFEFIGVDSSFRIVFRKSRNGQIDIYGQDTLIDSITKSQLKEAVEKSILKFAKSNNLGQWMNVAEANDFQDSLRSFQAFLC